MPRPKPMKCRNTAQKVQNFLLFHQCKNVKITDRKTVVFKVKDREGAAYRMKNGKWLFCILNDKGRLMELPSCADLIHYAA